LSTYYQEKIRYITDDLMLENFDLVSVFNEIKTTLQEESHSYFWKKLYKLRVKFQIHTPDYTFLNQLYKQGVFKSHEFVAVVDIIKAKVKSDISILTNTLEYTLNQYIPLKNSISVKHVEAFENVKGKNSIRIDIVELTFNVNKLNLKEVLVFLRWWNLDDFSFSKQIKITVDGKIRGTSEYDKIADFNVNKKPLQEVCDFLSNKDFKKAEEYLGHEYYFEILKNYMFPEGFENQAEITLDIVKDEIYPQKRRTVSIDGSSMKFHQIITDITPFKEYQRIIKENRIVGFYCSVKSVNDDLLYFLIDIDVPILFYSLFPHQMVWELTLNIAKSIIKTASRFGLPPFKVSFSGAKGLHLILALENPKVIQDIEKYVNFSELYRFSLLPGMKTLKKEKISSLNDKFKFAKSLLQSLLLYTVYKEEIKIPFEIRRRLQILYPYQLFRLSIDAKNRLAVLLDCSSMSRGVFRLYSPHPSSKLVSIPISDIKTNKICERYLKYENVREDAKLENVVQKFKDDNVELFFQKPNTITRDHIKNLLRPDKLLPAFATLLRFGTIYSIMRSPKSFAFWYRFFELRCFYAYIQDLVEHYESGEKENTINFIRNMAIRLKIEKKDPINNLIKLHLLHKKISFPLFKHLLNTCYYTEFFLNLKTEVILKKSEENIIELFQNEIQLSNFLKQVQDIFNIAIYTISNQVILEKEIHLTKEQIDIVNYFNKESSSLIDLAHHYLSELTHEQYSDEKEEQVIRVIHFISKLYFSLIGFIRKFYKTGEEQKVMEVWR